MIKKRIKYFCYYDYREGQFFREGVQAASTKIDYIIQAINKNGVAVDIISKSGVSIKGFAFNAGGVIKRGDNTIIAGQCYIIDSNHGTSAGLLIREQEDDVAENGIIIGDDVWIAAQCSILKGAIIHDHAVIGAQSLVNGEIPENGIAVGTPAKIIKLRT